MIIFIMMLDMHIYVNVHHIIGLMGQECDNLVERRSQEVAKDILEHLESLMFREPPVPFALAGAIMRDLQLSKSDFFLGMGRLSDKKVGEYIEGKRRYYFLLEPIQTFRERHRG